MSTAVGAVQINTQIWCETCMSSSVTMTDLPVRTVATREVVNDWSGWERAVPLLAVGMVLGVAFALIWFAEPLADDFARGYKGQAQGVLASTALEYRIWTGRWAAVFTNYFLTSSFNLVSAYPYLLLINPALLTLAIYALLRAARLGEGRWQRAGYTASVLALYWAGMPHPGETIYWLTGASDNLTGLALVLFLIAGLLSCQSESRLRLFASGAILSLLALVAAGYHELFGLLLCIVMAGGTWVLWRHDDRRRWVAASCLVLACASFLFVYNAPGNAVRRADFPDASNVLVALRLTLKQGVRSAADWALDLRLLSGTALFLMIAPATPASGRLALKAYDVLILAATWLLTLGVGFGAASWAIGMEMPERTRNGLYLLFLLGWFWLCIALRDALSGRQPALLVGTPLMRRIALGLFAAALLLTGNTWVGIEDLRGAAPRYRSALQARWAALVDARTRGATEVRLEPLVVRPRSYIAYFEVREDPEYWENWSVAHYFGLSRVVLDSSASRSRLE
jgi:hypothetical protein